MLEGHVLRRAFHREHEIGLRAVIVVGTGGAGGRGRVLLGGLRAALLPDEAVNGRVDRFVGQPGVDVDRLRRGRDLLLGLQLLQARGARAAAVRGTLRHRAISRAGVHAERARVARLLFPRSGASSDRATFRVVRGRGRPGRATALARAARGVQRQFFRI